MPGDICVALRVHSLVWNTHRVPSPPPPAPISEEIVSEAWGVEEPIRSGHGE